jgi:hypothetical protein
VDCCFKVNEQCFVKNDRGTSLIGDMMVRVSNKETSCTHGEKVISLIEVKPRNASLRLLPVCIGRLLKSVLIFKCLILDLYHPDTVELRNEECEDPRLFLEAKWVQQAKEVWETTIYVTKPRSFDASSVMQDPFYSERKMIKIKCNKV